MKVLVAPDAPLEHIRGHVQSQHACWDMSLQQHVLLRASWRASLGWCWLLEPLQLEVALRDVYTSHLWVSNSTAWARCSFDSLHVQRQKLCLWQRVVWTHRCESTEQNSQCWGPHLHNIHILSQTEPGQSCMLHMHALMPVALWVTPWSSSSSLVSPGRKPRVAMPWKPVL